MIRESNSREPIRVEVLCTDERHPINRCIDAWASKHRGKVELNIARQAAELSGGDLLFLVSCQEVVHRDTRARFTHALVLHASDLPRGRGWSPHVWQILEGKTEITITLLEAGDNVDSGDIWQQVKVHVPDHATWPEINAAICGATLELIDFAIKNWHSVVARPQSPDIRPTYYPRRRPEDSRLDLDKTIAEQFDLLRIADPERYPAYLEFRGHTYRIKLEKSDVTSDDY